MLQQAYDKERTSLSAAHDSIASYIIATVLLRLRTTSIAILYHVTQKIR